LLPGDIIATVRGTMSSQKRDGRDYLHVDTLDMDLDIKTVRMVVKKVFNNNRILSKYSNLLHRKEATCTTETTQETRITDVTSYNRIVHLQRLGYFAFVSHLLTSIQPSIFELGAHNFYNHSRKHVL